MLFGSVQNLEHHLCSRAVISPTEVLGKEKSPQGPTLFHSFDGFWLVTGFEEGPLSSTWQTAAMMKGWLLGMGQASALSDSDAMKY